MNEKAQLPIKAEPTFSQRFTNAVVREFSSQVGVVQLTPLQERLAQHLFVAIDNQLKVLEAKRATSNKQAAPIDWPNINMAKLAVDAVHRVELGLDALIPNHIHPIPYFNTRLKKYDLDLRIGYAGADTYKRKMATEPPIDIIYELVYSTDEFRPIKRDAENDNEGYEFEIKNPFDRGDVIGGFGYIVYKDRDKNKLVLVSKDEFDKSRKAAKSDAFWSSYPREMMFKTLVLRTLKHIPVDPEKVNASYMRVEVEELHENNVRQIEEQVPETIDIEPETEPTDTWPCDECSFVSATERGLKKHKTQSHKNEEPPPPPDADDSPAEVQAIKKQISERVAALEGGNRYLSKLLVENKINSISMNVKEGQFILKEFDAAIDKQNKGQEEGQENGKPGF